MIMANSYNGVTSRQELALMLNQGAAKNLFIGMRHSHHKPATLITKLRLNSFTRRENPLDKT